MRRDARIIVRAVSARRRPALGVGHTLERPLVREPVRHGPPQLHVELGPARPHPREHTRVGGSIPLMPALTEKGIDTILSGFALPESNVHSPNERFLVEYFAAGIDTVAALFTALGRLNG